MDSQSEQSLIEAARDPLFSITPRRRRVVLSEDGLRAAEQAEEEERAKAWAAEMGMQVDRERAEQYGLEQP